MLLLRSLKHVQRWRIVIALLLAVILVNFASVPRANAFLNLVDISVEDINVKLPSSAEWGEWGQQFRKRFRKEFEQIDTKTMGQQLGEGVRGEFEKFINSLDLESMGHQLGEGLRKQFEAAMAALFNEQIEPLVADIEKLLKARLEQADIIAKDRLAQLDKMIMDRLNQADSLIQASFERFKAAADETIAKVKTAIIGYAFERFDKAREESIAKADIIVHAANTFKKVTDETMAKLKAALIDHTFTPFDELRRNFRADVEHFFDRTEYFIKTVDCKVEGTLEKLRQDMQHIGKEFAQQLKAELSSLELKMTGSLRSGFSGGVLTEPESDSTPSVKPLTQCYQELGLMVPPKPWEYSSIYDLQKCEVLKTITDNTPLRRILNIYVDLQALAARMACLQRGSNKATLHYTWDWLEFGYWYDFWYAYY
jgi:2C-methyl-D-erythritol 2,4-cyclodiphosphate synthase